MWEKKEKGNTMSPATANRCCCSCISLSCSPGMYLQANMFLSKMLRTFPGLIVTLARGGTLPRGRALSPPCCAAGAELAAAVVAAAAAVAAVAAAENERTLIQNLRSLSGQSPAWQGISSEATAVWTGQACRPSLLPLLLPPSPSRTCGHPPDPSQALTEAP